MEGRKYGEGNRKEENNKGGDMSSAGRRMDGIASMAWMGECGRQTVRKETQTGRQAEGDQQMER